MEKEKMIFLDQFFLSTLFWRPVESMKPKQAFQLCYSPSDEEKLTANNCK